MGENFIKKNKIYIFPKNQIIERYHKLAGENLVFFFFCKIWPFYLENILIKIYIFIL